MIAVLDYLEQDVLEHPEKIVALPQSLLFKLQNTLQTVPLPDSADDFAMDEDEAAEYDELMAKVKAERQTNSVANDGE